MRARTGRCLYVYNENIASGPQLLRANASAVVPHVGDRHALHRRACCCEAQYPLAARTQRLAIELSRLVSIRSCSWSPLGGSCGAHGTDAPPLPRPRSGQPAEEHSRTQERAPCECFAQYLSRLIGEQFGKEGRGQRGGASSIVKPQSTSGTPIRCSLQGTPYVTPLKQLLTDQRHMVGAHHGRMWCANAEELSH